MAEAGPKTRRPGFIGLDECAQLLCLTKERVMQLVKDEVIPKAGRGEYPIVGAVQGYIKFLRADRRMTSQSQASSRLQQAKERQLQLKMAQEARELIPTEEAHAFTQMVVGTLMSRLSGLAQQVTRDGDQRRKLETAIDAIRSEVANLVKEYDGAYRFLREPDPADDEVGAGRLGED